jgi:putative polysaccharide transporter/flippase
MTNNNQNKAIKGIFWSAIERFSVQGIQFILSIIIARLVMPSEYGLIAMLTIFLAIAQCFIDSGFGNALIQKQNRTETDYSTVFYFNIAVALFFYFILYISAPYIASFYQEPQLNTITKWVGFNVVLMSFSIVQRTKLTINLDFKTQAKASLSAVIISGTIAIYLAYHKYGIWALVSQSLINNFLNTLFLSIQTRWIPKLAFSKQSFKRLFSFGSKLMLSGLLDTIYMNLYSLVIGRFYSPANVGFYNRSSTIAQYPSSNIVSIISRAIYPVQCSEQNDTEKLSNSFHKYLRMECYIIFPLMIGLAVLSGPLINTLLTEKWSPAAPLLSILSIAYMSYPIMSLNTQILKVKGRSDYFLKAEIIKKGVALIILCITLPFGIEILCLGLILYNIMDMAIIIFYAKKVIKTSYSKQIKELGPIFVLSVTMGLIVYVITQLFNYNNSLELIIGLIIGIIYYLGASKILKFQEFQILLSISSPYKHIN